MATLHILSHSPFADSRMGSCLRLLGAGDGLLLSGDAVYALQPGSIARQALELMPDSVTLHALAEDLDARTLTDLPERLNAVDYPAFIALCCHYDKVNSWL
ncbi:MULTISPECIES: sulfurtransferase complex subunit TusB [Pseudomonas]|uniref:sulfurtransferase complex subunit TusB n=1 Tax=Pseudomonadaceae TaxID=135621 RepID=UPI00040DD08A|nr:MULTISPECIES: sulfurtransferase complex subunit TusB [Pseudomonas]MDE3738551.1 sulfurtransferase complex subunit TusB [Pseudomonas resinovorans]